MENTDSPVQKALVAAANDCTTTTTNTSVVRPSRAGNTLLSLVLEDLVLPRLPQPKAGGKATAVGKLSSTISIGTGFLFEKALVPYLEEKYPEYTLIQQPKFQWQSFSGTADYLLLNYKTKRGLVIDAKAFRADTLREIKERKLTDGWSYPTQLAIYHMAADQDYGADLQIDAFWFIWSVSKAKLFVVEQPFYKSESLAKEAQVRAECFSAIKQMLEQGNFGAAAELATKKESECLPAKGFFYGRACASSKIHYNAYAPLFYTDEDPDSENYGMPTEGEPLRLLVERLMHDAYVAGADHSYYKNYLLDNDYEIS